MPNDIQVRIVKTIANVIQAAKPKAIVIPYWTLAQGLGESVPQLSSILEDEWGSLYPKWVHAYMLDFESDGRENMGSGSMRDTYELNLWGFYQWKLGNISHNSSFVFATHIEDVKDALSKASKGQHDGSTETNPVIPQSPGGIDEMQKHDEWQINKRGVYWFGNTRIHVAQGTLVVTANKIITPRPLG
jgi:hypothetical protein